jgi:uncharacterized protein YggE
VGKVTVRANLAQISVGVIVKGKTAPDAVKSSNDAMSALMKTLAAKGVAAADINTVNFSVNPKYSYDNSINGVEKPPTLTDYSVNSQLHVKVRKLATLPDVLGALVANGANNVSAVNFSVANPRSIRNRARKKAIADARAKAQLFAQGAGAKLGPALFVTESGSSFPTMEYGDQFNQSDESCSGGGCNGSEGSEQMVGAAQGEAQEQAQEQAQEAQQQAQQQAQQAQLEQEAQVPIAAGNQQVTVQVNAAWEIERGATRTPAAQPKSPH